MPEARWRLAGYSQPRQHTHHRFQRGVAHRLRRALRAIASFCGLLFGVTYRYIIRSDKNPQLKAGAVFAFGLVRGLTQIEVGWNVAGTVFPWMMLALESVFWFVLAAIALDITLRLGWIKPFKSD